MNISEDRVGFKRASAAPKITLKLYIDTRYSGKIVVNAHGVHLSFQTGADLSYAELADLIERVNKAKVEILAELARRANPQLF